MEGRDKKEEEKKRVKSKRRGKEKEAIKVERNDRGREEKQKR